MRSFSHVMKNNRRPSGPRSHYCTVHSSYESDGVSGLKACVNIGEDRSFVTTQKERGIVRTRVVFVPRSVEIKPPFSDLKPAVPDGTGAADESRGRKV